RGDHPLRWAGVEHLVVAGREQPISQRHCFKPLPRVIAGEHVEDVQITHDCRLQSVRRPPDLKIGWRVRAYKMVDPHTGNNLTRMLSLSREIRLKQFPSF